MVECAPQVVSDLADKNADNWWNDWDVNYIERSSGTPAIRLIPKLTDHWVALSINGLPELDYKRINLLTGSVDLESSASE
jgi:hypothetical protein